MDFLLKTLGALVLIGGGLLLTLVGAIWWFGRIMRKASASTLPPATVRLVPDAEPTWVRAAKPSRDIAVLEAEGFARAGTYTIEGIAGVRVLGLCHAGKGLMACVYEHPAVGNYVDVCADFRDGLELTASNAPSGQEIKTRPNTEKLFLKDKTAAEILEIVFARIAGRETVVVAPAEFSAHFERAYARDMAWRIAQGGMSEAEIRAIAANTGRSYTDEQLAMAFQQTKLQELIQRERECVETFTRSTTLSVAEWKQYEHRMIIFRDDFHPQAYLAYLGAEVTLEEDVEKRCRDALRAGLPLRDLLAKITAETRTGFVRLGAIDQPLAVEIYGLKRPPEEA